MRKYIIIALAEVCLFGLWPGEVHAQRGLPKQKGIQITAGWVDGFSFVKAGRRANFYGGVAFSRYNRNSTRWLVGLESVSYTHLDVYKRQGKGHELPELPERNRQSDGLLHDR